MSMEEDQEAARALRTLLEGSVVPPTRVDVGQAVLLGRRAERRRRGATGAVAVLAVLGVVGGATAVLGRTGDGRPEPAGPSPAATLGPVTTTPNVETIRVTVTDRNAPCEPTQLTLPSGYSSVIPQATDHTGRFILGISRPADGKTASHYVLWDRSVPSVLPGDAEQSWPVVNASGVVAGTGYDRIDGDKQGWEFGWIYQNGQTRRLPLLPGYDVMMAKGINDRGDVVGYAYRVNRAPKPGESAYRDSVPVIWPAGGSGEPRALSDPSRYSSRRMGVTEDGTVVALGSQIRIWRPDGTRADLRTPDGWKSVTGWQISGDWVTGWVDRRPTEQAPTPLMLWNIRTGKMYIYPDIDTGRGAVYVNRDGRMIVGNPQHGALVVDPDGTVGRLPAPPGAERWQKGMSVNAITDNGMVVGSAILPDGRRGFTWQCR